MNSNPTLENNLKLIDFLNDSTIKLLSNGTFGITFEITSSLPFTGISDKPLQKILMKLGIVDERNTSHTFMTKYEHIDLSTVKPADFKYENNIHSEIYTKSKEESQPLCPEIFSYYLLPISDLLVGGSILSNILVLMSNNQDLIDFFKGRKTFQAFGITFMEFLDGYETLSDIKERYVNKRERLIRSRKRTPTPAQLLGCENDYLQYVVRTMTGLIELALLGYNHADFHVSNIMFQKSTSGNTEYYPDLTDKCGRIMIIDFGQTVKIDNLKLDKIKQYYEEKKYTDILEEIYNSKRANQLKIYDPQYNFFYKYITGRYSSFHNINNTRQPAEITQHFNNLIDIVMSSRQKSKLDYSMKVYNHRRSLSRTQLSSLKAAKEADNLMDIAQIKQRYNNVLEELKQLIPCNLEQSVVAELPSYQENFRQSQNTNRPKIVTRKSKHPGKRGIHGNHKPKPGKTHKRHKK